MPSFSLFKKPVVTEKTQALELRGVYTVLVDDRATKVDIRTLFETLYGVKVANVNIIKIREKYHRTRTGVQQKRKSQKKAIVTLADAQRIPDMQKFRYKAQ